VLGLLGVTVRVMGPLVVSPDTTGVRLVGFRFTTRFAAAEVTVWAGVPGRLLVITQA